MPKSLSERMEEEEAHVLLFLLIWKDLSLLPTYPQMGSKSCSSLLKSE